MVKEVSFLTPHPVLLQIRPENCGWYEKVPASVLRRLFHKNKNILGDLKEKKGRKIDVASIKGQEAFCERMLLEQDFHKCLLGRLECRITLSLENISIHL